MKSITKELLLIVAAMAPLLTIIGIYSSLPETIPTHFGFDGPDAWGSKRQLFLIPGLLGPGLYLLFLFIPRLDPKGRITQMGEKWYSLKFIMLLFFMALSLYILRETTNNGKDMGSFLLVLFGAFFAALGNYFQTIRPNYFIGIRTPWTIENEQVWKDTHRLGGRMWMIGGIVLMSFYFVNNQYWQAALLIATVSVLALVPIIYSYMRYRVLKNNGK